MTLDQFIDFVFYPGSIELSELENLASGQLMLSIAGQESGWSHRLQLPIAYAHGYWQCERNGAVAGVMGDPRSAELLRPICQKFDIPFELDSVFAAIAYHDALAYCVARLTLWLDPAPLPEIGDVDGGWEYYLRVWRPGKPHPEAWESIYQQVSMSLKWS